MSKFKEDVIRIVQGIKFGCVTSYSDIAKMAGKPKCARSVGIIIKYAHLKGIKAPYHRVIRKNGEIGFGIGGRDRMNKKKIQALEKEGHKIVSIHKYHKARISQK